MLRRTLLVCSVLLGAIQPSIAQNGWSAIFSAVVVASFRDLADAHACAKGLGDEQIYLASKDRVRLALAAIGLDPFGADWTIGRLALHIESSRQVASAMSSEECHAAIDRNAAALRVAEMKAGEFGAATLGRKPAAQLSRPASE